MRKYINIINGVLFEDFGLRSKIEQIFKSESWQCIDHDSEEQIWEFQGKNILGVYWVHMNKHGLVGYIEYRSPISRVFNRIFNDTATFQKHIAELSHEDTDTDMETY